MSSKARGRSRTETRPAKAQQAETPRPRRNYARWRALCLSCVYVVFGAHIIHWKLTGKTLAPLELNEVMYTLELGIITAGFLFMCFLVAGTLFFGRFFCSWACHIMVLQDLCAWILRKFNIRQKPIRSRLLLLVPPLTAAYMFVWPQIVRAYQARALPQFHWATDREGWASLVTNNFWRNLPGPTIILLTFVVCGFVMVYLLGTRTFCTYVCPYGAIFALADRLAPGKIRVRDNCQQCGTCTQACTSGVRVHEEVKQHSMIVNPACLKDLDCVSACPQNALHYGFTRPALLKSLAGGGRFGRLPYDFSLGEESVMAVVFVTVLLSFRSLYSRIPFLLSLALGAVIGYLAIVALRLFTRPDVAVATLRLKHRGRLSGTGRAYLACTVVLAAFVGHSVFVRYHEYNGLKQARAIHAAETPADAQALATAARLHLLTADRWGLIRNPRVESSMLAVSSRLARLGEVEEYAQRLLRRYPDDAGVHLHLGQCFLQQGRLTEAQHHLQAVVAQTGGQSKEAARTLIEAHQALAGLAMRNGDFAAVAEELSASLALDPRQATVHAQLGGVLAELGRFDQATQSLSEAVRLDPGLAGAHYNLGVILGHAKRFEEAIPHYQRALAITPDDPDIHNNLAFALMRTGQPDQAEEHLERAAEIAGRRGQKPPRD